MSECAHRTKQRLKESGDYMCVFCGHVFVNPTPQPTELERGLLNGLKECVEAELRNELAAMDACAIRWQTLHGEVCEERDRLRAALESMLDICCDVELRRIAREVLGENNDK